MYKNLFPKYNRNYNHKDPQRNPARLMHVIPPDFVFRKQEMPPSFFRSGIMKTPEYYPSQIQIMPETDTAYTENNIYGASSVFFPSLKRLPSRFVSSQEHSAVSASVNLLLPDTFWYYSESCWSVDPHNCPSGICIRNFCHRKFSSPWYFLIKILRNSDHIIHFSVYSFSVDFRNVISTGIDDADFQDTRQRGRQDFSILIIDNSNIQLFRLITCFWIFRCGLKQKRTSEK